MRAEVSEVKSSPADLVLVAAEEFLAILGDTDEFGDGCCGQKFQCLVYQKYMIVDPPTRKLLRDTMIDSPTSFKQVFKGLACISGLSVEENLNRMAALVLAVSAWKRGEQPSEGNIVPHLQRRVAPSAAMAEVSGVPAPARRSGTAHVVAPLDRTALSIFEIKISSNPVQIEAMRLVDKMCLEDLNKEFSRLLECGLASLEEHLLRPVEELEKKFEKGSRNVLYSNYKTIVGVELRQQLEKRLGAKKWFDSVHDVKRVSAILVLAVASAVEFRPRKQAASSTQPQVRVCFLTPSTHKYLVSK